MHIRRMERADFPFVTTVAGEAFQRDELHGWLNSGSDASPLSYRMYILSRLRRRCSTRGQIAFVCVTDDEDPSDWPRDEIIGYSFWERYAHDKTTPAMRSWLSNNQDLFTRFEHSLVNLQAWYYDTFHLYDCLDYRRQKIWNSVLDVEKDIFAAIPDQLHLAVLGVSPKWHRKGAGTRLIKWGFQLAANENIPVTLVASEMGEKAYTSLGFKVLDIFCPRLEEMQDFKGGASMIWDPEELVTRPAQGDEIPVVVGRGRIRARDVMVKDELKASFEKKK